MVHCERLEVQSSAVITILTVLLRPLPHVVPESSLEFVFDSEKCEDRSRSPWTIKVNQTIDFKAILEVR
jgi:hypothetical protein